MGRWRRFRSGRRRPGRLRGFGGIRACLLAPGPSPGGRRGDVDDLDPKTREKYSQRDADGRLYQLTSLINPNPDRPNLTYEFLGVTRVWRWTKERMQEAYEAGQVVQTAPGRVPRLKRYLDEQRGKPSAKCVVGAGQADWARVARCCPSVRSLTSMVEGSAMDITAIEALAATASTALVTAAATDAFEGVRHRVARMFGRGQSDPKIEERLVATSEQLARAAPAELERKQAALAAQWQTRFADLLADYPDAEVELRALVEDLGAWCGGGNVTNTISGGTQHGPDSDGPRLHRHQVRRAASGARRMTPAAPDVGRRRGGNVRNVVAGGAQRGPVIMGRDFEVKVPLPERVGRPVSLPPRLAALAGREQLLADIHERLTEGKAPWPRVVALHGVGGAGKTSVAVEYAHRHLADVSVAWLFPAQDRTGLEAEFGRLAALLGASGGLLDPRDPVASVHGALADSPLTWLVVFDDAPNAGAVRDFLPPVGRAGC